MERTSYELVGPSRKGVLALGFVLGLLIGGGIENRTNDVAEGKQQTVEACRNDHPLGEQVPQDFMDCIRKGVEGGRPVGTHAFDADESPARVEVYRLDQQDEAQGINPEGIIVWTGIGTVAGAGVSIASAVRRAGRRP
jgi:hypothetical protein